MTASPSHLRHLLVLCAVLLVTVTGASVALGTDHPNYGLDIDGGVAVPPVTYSAEGESVEVATIARATSDGTLSFSVDAPAGEYYTVRIVDSEQRVVETDAGRGDESFEVPLRYYDVGTYVIAVTNESGDSREVYAAKPFVVEGYEVTQEADTSVDADGTIRVTATVEERGDPPAFSAVTVTVGNGSFRTVVEAERANATAYVAEIDASPFAPGEYTVVSGVRGGPAFDDTARELFGLSDSATVTVTEESGEAGTAGSTATTEPPSSGSGSSAGAGATTTASGTGTTVVGTSTLTSTATATATPQSADESTGTTTAAGTAGRTSGSTVTEPTGTTTTTNAAVTDTATATDTIAGTTETTGGLFHALGYALLLTASLVALRRRTE